MHPVLRLVSWNIGHRDAAWRELLQHGYDVALLQEAGEPPPDVAARVRVDAAPWRLGGREAAARPWRCVVVGLSDRVEVRHLPTAPIDEATREHIPVSRAGTLALAELRVSDSDVRFVVASMDAAFELPRTTAPLNWIYADASAHRLISDLSSIVTSERRHRIITAGDLKIVRPGDERDPYWAARYETVFDRMSALNLPCVGPERPADAAADRRQPVTSASVATYRTAADEPSSARRQIDYVFASEAIRPQLAVRAVVDGPSWGPSEHCRIEIDVTLNAASVR